MQRLVFLGILVFIAGWLCSNVYSELTFEAPSPQVQQSPLLEEEESGLYQNTMKELEKLQNSLSGQRNRESPQDWIAIEQIHVYNNRVVIDIADPEWAIFTDTKSMDPLIDSHSNAIEVVPKREEDIKVGDIAAYESEYAPGTITHRVVEIGSDEKGWYARLKGDNNERVDPGRVRFNQIKRVVVAIIY